MDLLNIVGELLAQRSAGAVDCIPRDHGCGRSGSHCAVAVPRSSIGRRREQHFRCRQLRPDHDSAASRHHGYRSQHREPGRSQLHLAVYGIGFAAGSTVQWNGTALSTTLAGSTQLSAAVPSSLLATPGTASITVVNSSGASSNAAPFHHAWREHSEREPRFDHRNRPGPIDSSGNAACAGSAVYWGSTPLATTFVSAAQLTAPGSSEPDFCRGQRADIRPGKRAATSLPITFTVLPAPGDHWSGSRFSDCGQRRDLSGRARDESDFGT